MVLVLLVVAIVSAMVIEFASDVFTSTNALYNWSLSQKVSLMAKSGVDLATKTIVDYPDKFPYTAEPVEIPFEKPFAESEASAVIKVIDENSKFNVNTLVYPNGLLNDRAYEAFKRLLTYLGLDVSIADYIVDWIDPDKEPRASGSEANAKNTPLDSIDELLLVKGIDKATYDKIAPYITIYGDGIVNINSAEIPVLLTLENFDKKEAVTEAMAERIIKYRKNQAFEARSDLKNVSGFGTFWQGIRGIDIRSSFFSITSSATDKGIKRTVSCIIDASGGILYWQEI